MEKIRRFLEQQGLDEREIAVYLGCLRQGDGTVLEISRQAKVKRSTTYLVLDELVKKGFVNSKQDKKSIHYFPTHPKKIVTSLKNQLAEAEEVVPELLSFYHDSSEKPSIALYDDMEGYAYTGDIVREAVMRGEELLVLGNVSFFFTESPQSAEPWFKLMRNKKYRAKILIYGWGDTEKEYVYRSRATGNEQLEIRIIKTAAFPVHTEQAVTHDTTILFTGGKKFSSIVIRSKNMADTFRTTFLQLWELGVEPETLE